MMVVFIVVEGKPMGSTNDALQRVRSVADYQFGRGTGKKLFPDEVEIQFSRATGRIRYVNLDGERLATLRPTDGMLSLSIGAAQLLVSRSGSCRCVVTVRSDVSRFVAEGGDVFAAHVAKVDESVHAKDEIVVVDEDGKVVGVGRALLSGPEMFAFRTGVAIKVRHGVDE
jgi:predicted RNA-binding protein (TIGR00451 family)